MPDPIPTSLASPTQHTIKTPQVAAQLGQSPFTVIAAIRAKRFPSPKKDSSGHFAWTQADIEAARAAFARGRRRLVKGGAA